MSSLVCPLSSDVLGLILRIAGLAMLFGAAFFSAVGITFPPRKLLAGIAAGFVLSHWPVLVRNYPFGFDEAVFLARAMTLLHDPVIFRSVDPTSSGPLTNYALVLPGLFGIPLDYLSCRSLGTCLLAGGLIASYYFLRSFLTERAAQLAVSLPAMFLGSTLSADFAGYGSEVVPVLLLLSALACGTSGRGAARSVIAGALLGCVPYGKLQAVPLGLAAGLFLFGRGESRAERLALIAGAAVPSAICYGILEAAGVFPTFWRSYVETNLFSATEVRAMEDRSLLGRVLLFFHINKQNPIWSTYVFSLSFALLVSTILRTRTSIAGVDRKLLLAVTLLAAYTVTQPGRDFPHYLLFLLYPLSWLVASELAQRTHPRASASMMAGVLVLPLALAVPCGLEPLPAPFPEGSLPPGHPICEVPRSKVAEWIHAHAEEAESLAVWGGKIELYAETGLRQATRSTIPFYERLEQSPGALREYYLQRYADDLARTKPEFFVDTTRGNDPQPGGERFAFESFPTVRDYVLAHYREEVSVEGVRVFRRIARSE